MRFQINTYPKSICYLLALILLLAVEWLVLVQSGSIDFFNTSDNAFTLVMYEKLVSSPSFILPMVNFIVAQLAIHLIFIVCNYYSFATLASLYYTNFISNMDRYSKTKTFIIFTLFLLFSYFTILVINNSYYPNSVYAFRDLTSNQTVLNLVNNYYFVLFCIFYSILTLFLGAILFIRNHFKSNHFLLFILLLTLTYMVFDRINNLYKTNYIVNNDVKKPNVVLITLDSFRYDHINKIHFNPLGDQNYIDIKKFSNNAIKFNNAYTPLARSFPALYSLLSGKHPRDEDVRFNLVNQNKIDFDSLLPSIFQKNGYETLYTTDSNQFHILNKDWGYQYLATPKQGVYEQVLPKINDLPLSNMIINSKISEYLFPYTYSNQAAHKVYDPLVYVNRVKQSINKVQKSKPVFFHFNFEAAHWPYQNRYLNSRQPFQGRYMSCINTLNWQVSQVFRHLRNSNLLNNTVVVIASDHGESLGIKDDRIINTKNYIGKKELLSYVNKQPVNYTYEEINAEKDKTLLDMILDINSSGGHGVDVLSPSQYQIVFTIQKYVDNQPVFDSEINQNPVTISDLYPTILELAKINTATTNSSQSEKSKQSISLVKYFNSNQEADDRNIFIETGLQVPYFKLEELEDKNILRTFIQQWSKYYTINDKNYLELTKDAVDKLLPTKQYAIINKQSILAYVPDGYKQQWRVVEDFANLETKNAANEKDAKCDIPRPVFGEDGQVMAMLCGYYADSPGYYVYYNRSLDKWTLYPSSDEFKSIPLVSKLYDNLKTHYESEINL